MTNRDFQTLPPYTYFGDVRIRDAMLLYTSPKCFSDPPENRTAGRATVVPWPEPNLPDHWFSSVGACFASWRDMSTHDQKFRLLIDAWHAAVFQEVTPQRLHEALLCIPEYRDMIADDCLPACYKSERLGQ